MPPRARRTCVAVQASVRRDTRTTLIRTPWFRRERSTGALQVLRGAASLPVVLLGGRLSPPTAGGGDGIAHAEQHVDAVGGGAGALAQPNPLGGGDTLAERESQRFRLRLRLGLTTGPCTDGASSHAALLACTQQARAAIEQRGPRPRRQATAHSGAARRCRSARRRTPPSSSRANLCTVHSAPSAAAGPPPYEPYS